MHSGKGCLLIGQPGCIKTISVTKESYAPRLVERRPVSHTIAECTMDMASVVRKMEGNVALSPAAFFLQRLRQIPVVERRHCGDAAALQTIHQTLVVVQPSTIQSTAPGRNHSRPGNREA